MAMKLSMFIRELLVVVPDKAPILDALPSVSAVIWLVSSHFFVKGLAPRSKSFTLNISSLLEEEVMDEKKPQFSVIVVLIMML